MADLPLIAGAGPVGLAAALFLARQGVPTRVIDRRAEPSTLSRALAVNPRTMEILEPTGLTEKMLGIGRPITCVQFWAGTTPLVQAGMDVLPNKRKFLLALSQAATERLLEEALEAAGGRVERGVDLVDCTNSKNAVEVTLRSEEKRNEQIRVPWLFAADGSHSIVRSAMDIAFDGRVLGRDWFLADVPLNDAPPADRAHVSFLPGGRFLFMLPVIDRHSARGPQLWRVLGNMPDPLEASDLIKPAGPAAWVSRFTISHRVAERFSEGNVYLGGDAAHVHSPVGARGMNLGIEDAWVFSQAVKNNRLAHFGEARRRVDLAVVRRIELITRMARGESLPSRFARRMILPQIVRVKPLRRLVLRTMSGLDHALVEA